MSETNDLQKDNSAGSKWKKYDESTFTDFGEIEPSTPGYPGDEGDGVSFGWYEGTIPADPATFEGAFPGSYTVTIPMDPTTFPIKEDELYRQMLAAGSTVPETECRELLTRALDIMKTEEVLPDRLSVYRQAEKVYPCLSVLTIRWCGSDDPEALGDRSIPACGEQFEVAKCIGDALREYGKADPALWDTMTREELLGGMASLIYYYELSAHPYFTERINELTEYLNGREEPEAADDVTKAPDEPEDTQRDGAGE